MPIPNFLSASPNLLNELDTPLWEPMTYLANEPTHFLNCTKQLRAWVKASMKDRRPLGPKSPRKPQDMVSDFEPRGVALMLFVGTDVGGTLTDVVIFDEESRKSPEVLKVPTNPKHPESAILEALERYQNRTGQFALISHATTIATNSLLTKSGLAETALITNEGFRDVLEIGRQRRPEIYNLNTKRPRQLVTRRNRFTVRGRRLVNGSSLESLVEEDLLTVSKTIIERGIESVAISFLNSYVNP